MYYMRKMCKVRSKLNSESMQKVYVFGRKVSKENSAAMRAHSLLGHLCRSSLTLPSAIQSCLTRVFDPLAQAQRCPGQLHFRECRQSSPFWGQSPCLPLPQPPLSSLSLPFYLRILAALKSG